jgi:hypothetical protein
MTESQLLDAILRYGLPAVVVVLMIFEVLVPKGRLKREEARADKAMDIAEDIVPAVNSNTTAINGLAERLDRLERKLE